LLGLILMDGLKNRAAQRFAPLRLYLGNGTSGGRCTRGIESTDGERDGQRLTSAGSRHPDPQFGVRNGKDQILQDGTNLLMVRSRAAVIRNDCRRPQQIAGRRYPARRTTQNLVGGVSPIQAQHFCIGNVTLDADGDSALAQSRPGGSVLRPGRQAEMCLGEERGCSRGQAVYFPRGVSPVDQHRGNSVPYAVLLCPAGDVAHCGRNWMARCRARRRARGCLRVSTAVLCPEILAHREARLPFMPPWTKDLSTR